MGLTIGIIILTIIVVAVVAFNHDTQRRNRFVEGMKNDYRVKREKFLSGLQEKYGRITILPDPFTPEEFNLLEDDGFYVVDIRNASKIIIREMVVTAWGSPSEQKFPCMLSYSDIYDYELYEEEVFDPDSVTSISTTKSNTFSLVGRAAIGALIAGGAGAVVGGLTGHKTATTKSNQARGLKFYSLCIKVKGYKEVISIGRYKYESYTSQCIHWDVWNKRLFKNRINIK